MTDVAFLTSSEVLEQLHSSLRDASSFDFAVAFVKKDGYAAIEDDFAKLLRRGCPVRIVIGISSYGITDWQVLRSLCSLKDEHGNLAVKYYCSEGFHPKLVIFGMNGARVQVILGSSNLTGGGVTTNVEANLLLNGSTSEKPIADILEFFEQVFAWTPALERDVVTQYGSFCRQQRHRKRRSNKGLGIEKTPMFPVVTRFVRPPAPTIPSIDLRGKSIWKVAPGEDGAQWEFWESEIGKDGSGIIAIGWIDMTKLPFEDRPTERLKFEVKDKLNAIGDNTPPGYVAKQAWFFCRGIKRSDLIVAYSKSQIYGIAEVTDDEPHYVPTKDPDKEKYPNRRNVRWLTLLRRRPAKRFMDVLATEDTVHRIDDSETVKMIQGILRRHTLN